MVLISSFLADIAVINIFFIELGISSQFPRTCVCVFFFSVLCAKRHTKEQCMYTCFFTSLIYIQHICDLNSKLMHM